MNRYIYKYQTTVLFSEPVTRHSIMLRAQPFANAYITAEEEQFLISPSFHIRHGLDQFGNHIAYGYSEEAHTNLVTVSCGIVRMEDYHVPQDHIPLMAYQTAHATHVPAARRLTEPAERCFHGCSIHLPSRKLIHALRAKCDDQ